LETGLKRLATHFPWVAGQVVYEGSAFKIKPFEDLPLLLVKDLRGRLPAFGEYQAAGFPFRMLDENVIAPRNTLPERFGEPAPVMLLQATIVHGGVLLVVSGQHNCMDIRGQAQILHLLAKACRSEKYSEEEMQGGNLPRADIIPLSNEYDGSREDGSALPQNRNEGAKRDTPTCDHIGKQQSSCWTYFLFSRLSLASLKEIAVEPLSSGFVSTDDVLSAFIWQAITRTRLARPEFPATYNVASTTLDRQVDARKHLGIPTAYTGNVVHKVSTTLPMQRLCEIPLGHLASHLRKCLQGSNTAYEVSRAATKVQQSRVRLSQSSSLGMFGTLRSTLPLTDVRISSWAKEECYHLDFGGLLGKPEAVRRPSFQAWEGLVYILPRRPDGELAVAVCLHPEDVLRLRNDEGFLKYCDYIG
jgi:hypothetical protein